MKTTKLQLLVITLLLSVLSVYSKQINLQIIYTSDEHGWMIQEGKNGGAAEMYEQWLIQDSIQYKNTLILSGGDNFTGPAISTYTKGQAMLNVMNAMGYQFSTIGNHEFDFGQEELRKLLLNSGYKYLAANMQFSSETSIFKNIQPYTTLNIDDINIFIIGLANIETSTLSSEKNLKGIKFIDYSTALDMYKDKIKDADIAILLSHICSEELKQMQPRLSEMGFDLITGGHCHNPIAEIHDGIPIIEGMPYLRGYAKIPIIYDTETKSIVSISASQVLNQSTVKNHLIDSIITKWKDSTNIILNRPIGYADAEIQIDTPDLLNLILSSWLKQLPDATIALTNRGSIRQGIPKGDISLSTIMGVMPFDNELVTISMKGSDIKELLREKKPYVYGVDVNNNFELLSGSELLDNSQYTVIINNFIYNGGDKYNFKSKSKLISNTGINMREPVINYLNKSNTSWNRPINRNLNTKLFFEK